MRSVTLDGDVYEPSGTMSGGAAPSRSGVLVRAQELRGAEEQVANARRSLEALECEEPKGWSARGAWRAHTCEVEIMEHGQRLSQEQVGASNAARVSHSSSHLPLDIPLTKCLPPVVDRHASSRAQAVHRRDGGCRQGCAGEAAAAKADIKKLEKDMDELTGKTEELKVKLFPFFIPEFIVLNGFPFAGQHTGAKGDTAEAGREREDTTERNADGNPGTRFVFVYPSLGRVYR